MNKDHYIDLIKKQKFITSGKNNESVDGSGWNPSVNDDNVEKIFSFIKEETPHIDWPQAKVFDIGTGLGYLPKYLNSQGITCIGAEGSSELVDKSVSSENTVVWDLAVPFESINLPFDQENLKNLFDVSFSFEVIEHVSPFDQYVFWQNIFAISKYHICSIHVENGVNEYHKCMLSEQQWIEFFQKNNIKVIKNIPRKDWIEKAVPWECSVFFVLSS